MTTLEESNNPTVGEYDDKPKSPSSLRLLWQGTAMLNRLFSCEDCYPFVSPVPATEVYYHEKVSKPMDLSTCESNLHARYYHSLDDMEQDLRLIWNNAREFHQPLDVIYEQATRLLSFYTELENRIETEQSEPSREIPELADTQPVTFPLINSSALYFTQIIAPNEQHARALRGFSKTRHIFDQLHTPFFNAIEEFKRDGVAQTPFPRLYISQNRTLLTEARDVDAGLMAVLYNFKEQPCDDPLLLEHDLHQCTTDVALVQLVGECHDMITPDFGQVEQLDYHPKAWFKVKIVKVMSNVETVMAGTMEKNYFRRAFATHRLTSRRAHDLKKAGDMSEVVSLFIHAILNGESYNNLPANIRDYLEEQTALEKKRSFDDTDPDHDAEQEVSGKKRKKRRGRLPRSLLTGEEAKTGVNGDLSEAMKRLNTAVASPMTFRRYLEPSESNLENDIDQSEQDLADYYRTKASQIWDKVRKMCDEKNVQVTNIENYMDNTSAFPNAEGTFKRVYYVNGDSSRVVQTFRRMTLMQRTTELASLLALRDEPGMGQIVEVLVESQHGEIVGLAMERYQKTLKQYTHSHSHHRLTPHQKMDLIQQMLQCMDTIHEHGLAHRDLSEVNFMVNEDKKRILADGSIGAELYLIDFGKAIFTTPKDVRYWWAEHSRIDGDYEGEVVPETTEELEEWCASLPWIQSKPDHGYRRYRSIQTLPLARTDMDVLPWRILPIAEDMYSIGTMIWKVFTETEPWHGILDDDLKGLREAVRDDEEIQKRLEREVHGEVSRQLLAHCLEADPEKRSTAKEVLEWLEQSDIRDGLLKEWEAHAPANRQKRRAKIALEYDTTPPPKRRGRPPAASVTGRLRGRPKGSTSKYIPTGRPRGRPRGSGKRGRPSRVVHDDHDGPYPLPSLWSLDHPTFKMDMSSTQPESMMMPPPPISSLDTSMMLLPPPTPPPLPAMQAQSLPPLSQLVPSPPSSLSGPGLQHHSVFPTGAVLAPPTMLANNLSSPSIPPPVTGTAPLQLPSVDQITSSPRFTLSSESPSTPTS